jgi:hypothetical protein
MGCSFDSPIKPSDLLGFFRLAKQRDAVFEKFRRVLPLSFRYVYGRYASFSRLDGNG